MMNNEYDYGAREVFMNIQQAARWMDPFFKIGVIGAVVLIQFMARMAKEHLISEKDCTNVQSFMKATDGKYDIMNVPSVDVAIEKKQKGFGKITREGGMIVVGDADTQMKIPELDSLGIRYMVMPDLDKDDGLMQIAIDQKDRDKFAAWYERYLMGQMTGGEKNLRELKNLTAGKTSIVSAPLEGKEDMLKEDFDALGISYSRFPDLHVGDGAIQFAVANSDLAKVEHWYGLYKADMLKKGEEIKDMSVVSLDQYRETGKMSEQEYVSTASPELKAANEKYEGKEAGEIEHAVADRAVRIRSADHEAYESLANNPSYIPLSINKETLVECSSVAGLSDLQEKGYFVSRVPGTWGENEMLLEIPTEQVFLTDEGRTYIAFLEEDKRAMLVHPDGYPVSVTQRPFGNELYHEHYEKAERSFRELERLQKPQEEMVKGNMKDVAKTIIPEKTPTIPLKIK